MRDEFSGSDRSSALSEQPRAEAPDLKSGARCNKMRRRECSNTECLSSLPAQMEYGSQIADFEYRAT